MNFTRICTFAMLFLAVSCKKDHTCQCTSSKGTYESGTLESTKSYAKKYCKDLSAGETTCELKN
ncbi:MAG: hypothetical protein V4565_11460 [Bacteroidota bacterium]